MEVAATLKYKLWLFYFSIVIVEAGEQNAAEAWAVVIKVQRGQTNLK